MCVCKYGAYGVPGTVLSSLSMLIDFLTLTATLWGRASPFYRWGTKKQFAQDQMANKRQRQDLNWDSLGFQIPCSLQAVIYLIGLSLG